MESRIDEIGAGIHCLSIFVSDAAPPAGLTFNHFLFTGDEPLLFHCGKRKMFPLVSAAVARVMAVERLRWLGFGHFKTVNTRTVPIPSCRRRSTTSWSRHARSWMTGGAKARHDVGR